MITLDRMVAEARRELGMRRKAYPRWVANGRMTQAQADERIELQQAIVDKLEELRKAEQQKTTPELF